MQQQQVQIDEAIAEAQAESLIKQADEMKMSIKKFDKILQPIIEQCTKDSISAGKIGMVLFGGSYTFLSNLS